MINGPSTRPAKRGFAQGKPIMKFKNIKNTPPVSVKKNQSPSNSRSITEKLLKLYGGILKIFVVFIFIVAVVIVGYDFQKNLQIKQEVDLQREALAHDLNFWEDFISKQQNYRDAYFQASILEYKLGSTSKAKMYVEKGLSLDPNSQDGKKIEEFLSK